jgi:cytidylate kinase
MENYVINIGRQLGSGGRVIGQLLAKELGIGYYDKELIQLASKESGLGKEFFERADEKARFNFLGSFWAGFSNFVNDGFYSDNLLENDSLFQIQSDVIREQAAKRSCIFIGRCADYVLREHPRSLNIFLCAHEADRISRIVAAEKVTAAKAKELLEHVDRKRAGYYSYYSGKAWGAAASYHLCLNTSAIGLEETAKFIKAFAKERLNI